MVTWFSILEKLEQRQNYCQSFHRHKQSSHLNHIVKQFLFQQGEVGVQMHDECPHRGQNKSRLMHREKKSFIPQYVTCVLNISTCNLSCNLPFSVILSNVEHSLFLIFLLLFVSLPVRTALIAIIGFMPTKGEGAIGSLDYTPEERKALAKK